MVIVRDYVKKTVICARDIDRHRPKADENLVIAPKDKRGKIGGRSDSHYALEDDKDKAEKKVWHVQVTCIDVASDGRMLAVGQDDGGFSIMELKYDEHRVLRIVDK